MLYKVDLAGSLSLILAEPASSAPAYPSDRVQKGWLLARNGRWLAHEGAGFGFPVIKDRGRTIFPGEALVEVTERPRLQAQVIFIMNLVEEAGSSGTLCQKAEPPRGIFWPLRRETTALVQGHEGGAGPAGTAMILETRLENGPTLGTVAVNYAIGNDATIHVRAQFDGCNSIARTGIIMANEQSAVYFDRYEDSSGLLLEREDIGAWTETTAGSAALVDAAHLVRFSVHKAPPARLFRRWERNVGHLDRAGLNFVLPAWIREFSYAIRLDHW